MSNITLTRFARAAVALALMSGAVFAVAAAPGASALAETTATDSIAGSYLAGRYAQRIQDYAAAVDFLARSHAADPQNQDVLRQLFLLAVAEGRSELASELATTVLEVTPSEPLPVLVLLIDALARDDLDAARALLDSGETYGLNQITMPIARAWIAYAEGDGEQAYAALDAARDENGVDALYNVHIGMIADLLGDADRAAAAYAQAAGAEGGLSFRAVDAYGRFLERQGRPEEAVALYQSFATSEQARQMVRPSLQRIAAGGVAQPAVDGPKAAIADMLFSVASSLQQEGNSVFAYAYARLALRLDPGNGLARMLVAGALEDQGRLDQAVAAYALVPADSPMAWSAGLARAEALNTLERTDEAVTLLEQMAAAQPDDYLPLAAVGNFLRAQQKFERAVEAYDAAFARIGEVGADHWTLLYYRGIALERAGMWDRAEADFLTALELQPDQPFVLNYLGYSWVEQGKNLDRAQQMIESAVEQRPRDGFIVDSLGWVLYKLGDFAAAAPYLERAVELEPADPVINDHLGDALWRVGRVNEARFQWRRAAGLAPEQDLAAEIDRKLAEGLPEDDQDGE